MILAFLAILPFTYGAPTINTPETWDTPGNLEGWTYAVGSPPLGGASAVGVDGTMGGTPAALHVTFAAQGVPAPEDEKIYAVAASSGGIFAGNQSYVPAGEGSYYATFNFYADDYTTPANTLKFFFESDTSGRVWTYSLSGPAAIDSWYSYTVPISYSASWLSPGFGAAEFAADMLDVDQIGIWVYRASNTGAQNYGLDDFEVGFQIPEPSTYVILAFTLLTLGLTLRRKQILSFQPVRAFFSR